MAPAVLEKAEETTSPTVDVSILSSLIEEVKINPTYSPEGSYLQYVNYRSEGSTRVEINGSRHYKTPYGALPSVTTILSATSGNKAALERWAKKNPGGREAAAARGTAVHALMENYLLGIDRDPVVEDDEVRSFWQHLPEPLSKLGRIIWAENPVDDNYSWTMGGDGISRVWHPGPVKGQNHGWAGAPDIVAEYKGKIVLGDLKTSNGLYFSKWPDKDTPKQEYGMRRAGFMKYTKCMLQLAAYNMGLEHTVGIKPDIHMIFVATRERGQVFAIQAGTIEKYKQKWLETVEKYYESLEFPEIDIEIVDGDSENSTTT